jgi:hypothetical protein
LTAAIREIGKPLPALEPTVEDQVETGAVVTMGPMQVGLTAYYRASDNPVHTTVWPDSRIYSYASFDRGRAHGVEVKAELPGLAQHGVTAQLNYATGRVYFYNPVTGGSDAHADRGDDVAARPHRTVAGGGDRIRQRYADWPRRGARPRRGRGGSRP